jgi:hypothetical protein
MTATLPLYQAASHSDSFKWCREAGRRVSDPVASPPLLRVVIRAGQLSLQASSLYIDSIVSFSRTSKAASALMLVHSDQVSEQASEPPRNSIGVGSTMYLTS